MKFSWNIQVPHLKFYFTPYTSILYIVGFVYYCVLKPMVIEINIIAMTVQCHLEIMLSSLMCLTSYFISQWHNIWYGHIPQYGKDK